jgi:hypothetical protein
MSTVLLIIVVFSGISYFTVFFTRNHLKIKKYYNTATQGTRCYFFIDEDRCTGLISWRDGDAISIHHRGRNYRRFITDTYPV